MRLRSSAFSVAAILGAASLAGCGIIVGFSDLVPPSDRKDARVDGTFDAAPGRSDASDATLPKSEAGPPHDAHVRLDASAPLDAAKDGGTDSGPPDAPSGDAQLCDTMCDGALICLASDKNHCGSCTNACDPQGASPLCGAGSCSLVTLVTDAGTPLALTLDDASVFWTAIGGLSQLPLGGGTATLLSTQSGFDLVVDSSGVYGVTEEGSLWRVGLTGGETTLGPANVVAGGLATDSDNIYVLLAGTVYRRAKEGDASLVPIGADAAVSSGRFSNLILSGGRFYWGGSEDVNSDQLVAEGVDGGAYATLLTDVSVVSVAIANGSLYFTGALPGSGANVLAKISTDGGDASVVVNGIAAGTVVTDGNYVYWVDGTRILAAPATGLPAGAAPTILSPGTATSHIEGLSLSRTSLYWVDNGTNTVMRAKKLLPP